MTNQQQPPNHPYAAPPNQQYAPQQPNQPYAPQQQQPPHPYAAQQPPHPHPQAAQQPGPYQQQYAQHPYQQPPQHPTPSVPEAVGDFRRWGAALVDGLIALFGGFKLADLLTQGESVGTFWGYLVGLVLGISFVHHVFGALIFRTTVGKFLCTTRVVRSEDCGRPRFWQTVRRWLLGLTWLPMQLPLSLISGEGEPYDDDHCGLRYVRSKDLG
ncbi:RDD family protein [Streptomyces cavernicola]|uniref:RDD family protein n=1 Tax=Streptomyces cavernicola TaxID=3043613 RepID=A0ABT6S4T9_9ACTN|nr:RDD family protein [Streptomyces sp. B-S-A6]MDI3403107.1 RDD family protein [Streptomyces sp. B-S-A6]